MPIEMQCISCEGGGCMECGDTGRLTIDRCPQEWIDGDIVMLLEAVDLYEKGLPPVAGGMLDQCGQFIEAARFVMAERSYWKAKLRLHG